ncbi:hypothetical protein CFP75_22480 [Amycolatopsis alba DSM 44262]|uniref:Uncharacterized protein n=1 Tax=Amycolatopsis alba DSM 44262 TaxID=1125972 RepID=A0A229RNR9_AMYAL|nr:hypothetical protein CFP75_22480 [Amycolatopsis alba DSM 44262]
MKGPFNAKFALKGPFAASRAGLRLGSGCCESHFRNHQRCESGFRNTAGHRTAPGPLRRGPSQRLRPPWRPARPQDVAKVAFTTFNVAKVAFATPQTQTPRRPESGFRDTGRPESGFRDASRQRQRHPGPKYMKGVLHVTR